MKTSTIPYLSRSRYRQAGGGGSPQLMTASEDELAALSEQTLQSLQKRVREFSQQEVGEESESLTEGEGSAGALTQSQVEEATRKLVKNVLERTGASGSIVLLFVGSEPNHHVDELTARIASALCDHSESRVLLVDSDDVNRNLTRAARQMPTIGVTEMIEYNKDYRDAVVENQSSNLDFMPAGNGCFGRWNEKELLQNAVAEMKGDYQFVCVAGGDAHGNAAKLWSEVCDGSYLLVSAKHSNGVVAKSAVAELKSRGSRLLGCVLTDVDEV